MTLFNISRILGMILCIVLLFSVKLYAQSQISKPLFFENFNGKLDKKYWKAEIEPVGESGVYSQEGKLILNTAGGVTVWFCQKMKGNLRIEYDWTVLVNGEKNDRLSDLNQFWMATDPRSKNLFSRNGKFENYDSLSLYYVGYGGNKNSTTRFRKYLGNGHKPLLKEYTDGSNLLIANHTYHLVVTVMNGKISFYSDGKVLFEYQDPDPLTEGYFGFRSTASHHAIDNFSVLAL